MALQDILAYLEENIEPEHLDQVENKLINALHYKPMERLPIRIMYPQHKFAKLPYGATFENMENMLYNELAGGVTSVESKDDGLLTLRSNYGVGTLPSLFGMISRVVKDTNLPWVDHVDSVDMIRDIIHRGVPDLHTGFGKRMTETYEYYREQLQPYEKCNTYIKLYHPDLQGPFDVAHLIWGPDIYIAMYDTPDLVHELMNLVTETYIQLMKKLKGYLNDEIINEQGAFNYHWGSLYKGKVLLRNDSAVNLSKAMFEEFVLPYDTKILETFGSGSIHFCGRADQIVFDMAETPYNQGMNFGHMGNVEFGETYLDLLKERFEANKTAIISYHLSAEEYQNYRGTFDTGITLQSYAPSYEEAIKLRHCHEFL
ncbi:hypothetical protein HZI73_12525 [Vallitalea pronyensis]|uniref:Uroporphyrinogen decarboxylase (URO-D) domain-containing protein n=1 Tax=Vallitalea pronyensis TaxID=1348613 RepID=A0A8J8MK98_9FIRM|nr:hypothetical protein [Vallitalea pronyensis]QUI23061.1 hypothetical protein HZI73_12525 [Vallitalea pronyensis]